MPFYLKERDVSPELAGLKSALIVPCHFCPAATTAVREKKPYVELFDNLLRTKAYERYIEALRERLEAQGFRVGVFDSKLPWHYVVCMWTAGRRAELAERAEKYDAIVVLGCDETVATVNNAIGSTGCKVIPAMEIEGVMNIQPTISFPFNISIEKQGLTPVSTRPSESRGANGRPHAVASGRR